MQIIYQRVRTVQFLLMSASIFIPPKLSIQIYIQIMDPSKDPKGKDSKPSNQNIAPRSLPPRNIVLTYFKQNLWEGQRQQPANYQKVILNQKQEKGAQNAEDALQLTEKQRKLKVHSFPILHIFPVPFEKICFDHFANSPIKCCQYQSHQSLKPTSRSCLKPYTYTYKGKEMVLWKKNCPLVQYQSEMSQLISFVTSDITILNYYEKLLFQDWLSDPKKTPLLWSIEEQIFVYLSKFQKQFFTEMMTTGLQYLEYESLPQESQKIQDVKNFMLHIILKHHHILSQTQKIGEEEIFTKYSGLSKEVLQKLNYSSEFIRGLVLASIKRNYGEEFFSQKMKRYFAISPQSWQEMIQNGNVEFKYLAGDLDKLLDKSIIFHHVSFMNPIPEQFLINVSQNRHRQQLVINQLPAMFNVLYPINQVLLSSQYLCSKSNQLKKRTHIIIFKFLIVQQHEIKDFLNGMGEFLIIMLGIIAKKYDSLILYQYEKSENGHNHANNVNKQQSDSEKDNLMVINPFEHHEHEPEPEQKKIFEKVYSQLKGIPVSNLTMEKIQQPLSKRSIAELSFLLRQFYKLNLLIKKQQYHGQISQRRKRRKIDPLSQQELKASEVKRKEHQGMEAKENQQKVEAKNQENHVKNQEQNQVEPKQEVQNEVEVKCQELKKEGELKQEEVQKKVEVKQEERQNEGEIKQEEVQKKVVKYQESEVKQEEVEEKQQEALKKAQEIQQNTVEAQQEEVQKEEEKKRQVRQEGDAQQEQNS